jgi:outer membrane protein
MGCLSVGFRQFTLFLACGIWASASGPAVSQQLPPSGPGPGLADLPRMEEAPFFIRLGAGYAGYRTSGSATSGGARIDDARVAFGGHAVGTVEAGWRVSPNWSLSVLSGLPPTVSLKGHGAFEDFQELRKVTYGSVMAGVQFHPLGHGWIDPYIGGGVDYTFIFRTYGGSLSELRVADSFGPILQAGADIRLTERLSLYADVRKIWLSFDAKGVAPSPSGLFPVRVEVHPNPIVATIGISYHF